MALLTDGMISSLDDLQALDSNVLETARTEGVDLQAKLGVAEQAVQLEVAAFLLRTKADSISSGVTGAYDLSRVVVTTGVRRWHGLLTLAELYGDAYSSQLNDRYLGRWKYFAKLAKDTSDLLYELGVGIVASPVRRAAKPTVTATGTGGASASYIVRIAWRLSTGQCGAASEPCSVDATGGELFVIQPPAAPNGVAGYDVYAGAGGDAPTRQNAQLVTAGQSWTLPLTGLIAGAPLGEGQMPDYYVRRSRVM